MIEIKAATEEEFEHYMDNDIDFIPSLVNEIMDAVDNKFDKFLFAKIKPLGINLIINKETYLDNLKGNIQKLIDKEEYELCSKVRDYIDKLEN